MTICEYIRNKYMQYVETPDNEKPWVFYEEQGSFEYFKLFCEYICDGGWSFEFAKAGITDEQIQKAIESKYVRVINYTNWEARQTGRTKAYVLTAKGKKACYSAYKEW